MNLAFQALLAVGILASVSGQASAPWWVGGHSYSQRVDKYDSFYGEARPVRWSIERPPGVHWQHMLEPKRVIQDRMYNASSGYPAVYRAAYPSTYHAGLPAGDAVGYEFGYPAGYPVGVIADESQAATWRPPAVQVDPLPGDRDLSVPYPAEDIPPPSETALPGDENR